MSEGDFDGQGSQKDLPPIIANHLNGLGKDIFSAISDEVGRGYFLVSTAPSPNEYDVRGTPLKDVRLVARVDEKKLQSDKFRCEPPKPQEQRCVVLLSAPSSSINGNPINPVLAKWDIDNDGKLKQERTEYDHDLANPAVTTAIRSYATDGNVIPNTNDKLMGVEVFEPAGNARITLHSFAVGKNSDGAEKYLKKIDYPDIRDVGTFAESRGHIWRPIRQPQK